MNIKRLFVFLTFAFVFFVNTSNVSAHVTVKPGEVGAGERLNFTVSVPTEEDAPTVMVRLVIPEGVQSVRPNAKEGWNIQLKKVVEGDTERISEIVWSGGRIPAELRDEFVFSAQVPAEETTLVWKAYQTYGDGDVVAWENSAEAIAEFTKNNPPKETMDGMSDNHDAPRPYSTTKVVNDLKGADTSVVGKSEDGEKGVKTLSIVAIALSIVAIGIQFGKKN